MVHLGEDDLINKYPAIFVQESGLSKFLENSKNTISSDIILIKTEILP